MCVRVSEDVCMFVRLGYVGLDFCLRRSVCSLSLVMEQDRSSTWFFLVAGMVSLWVAGFWLLDLKNRAEC